MTIWGFLQELFKTNQMGHLRPPHCGTQKRVAWLEERMGALQSIKMIDVQVSRVSSKGPRSTKATVLLSMSWHGRDMVQKQSLWEQTWEHKKKLGWRLVKEKPAIIKRPAPVKRGAWP